VNLGILWSNSLMAVIWTAKLSCTKRKLSLSRTGQAAYLSLSSSSLLIKTSGREISFLINVPLRRKIVGLFRPNSVAEYSVVSIFVSVCTNIPQNRLSVSNFIPFSSR